MDWYRDPKLLRAAHEKYGSFAAIERELGGPDESTLQKEWARQRLPKLTPGPKPRKPVNEEALKELYDSIYG